MKKELYFGLTKQNRRHELDEDEYELYFINDSDSPVTIRKKSYGGFATEEDTVIMAKPRDTDVDIRVEAHGYELCYRLYRGMERDDFDGANQYEFHIETAEGMKVLEFYLSGSPGFMGNFIPALQKYGRTIYPKIYDYEEYEKKQNI
jgi:hypothetical protein